MTSTVQDHVPAYHQAHSVLIYVEMDVLQVQAVAHTRCRDVAP